MKAPDKMHIGCYDPSLERGFATSSVEKMKSDDIEYIRKDLLLEWAKELTSEPYDRTTVSALKHQIAHYLLEKYNSL